MLTNPESGRNVSGGHELLGGDNWRAVGHGPGTRQSQDEVVQHCPPHPAPQIHICGDRSPPNLMELARPGDMDDSPFAEGGVQCHNQSFLLE